jgi:GNAT superfamily N-acetyltransferase
VSSRRIVIRPFAEGDATATVDLLRTSSPEYVRFFRPFAFENAAINKLLAAARKDCWFAMEVVDDNATTTRAGFYTLRGLDEGFADPMYGIFIAQEFSGRGLARLSFAHAESMCRLNGWSNLLLKVDPANTRAFALYTATGFRFLRMDSATGNQVLIKPIGSEARVPASASHL